MHNTILIRYGEISLKGKNRALFERKLVKNIKNCLKQNKIIYSSISRPRNRIIIETERGCNQLKNVFGIISFSYAICTKADIDEIKKAASKLIVGLNRKKKFRVTTKRLDKSTDLKSIEFDNILGKYIQEKTKAKVNLKNYDFELGIEILKGNAYIFTKRIKGPGGLPVGIEGKVLVLIKGKNAKKACQLMQKRGCETISIKRLSEVKKYPDARALVVGQTLENLKKIRTRLPVLRPLIAR